MPLCIPKRNLGSDILQCMSAVENSGAEEAIVLPLTHQAGLCGPLRTTIYRSPAEPGQLDLALRLPTRIMWLPPYTSVRDEPVEAGGALSWLRHGRQSQQIRASPG